MMIFEPVRTFAVSPKADALTLKKLLFVKVCFDPKRTLETGNQPTFAAGARLSYSPLPIRLAVYYTAVQDRQDVMKAT
jgi:hypothetical protein